MSIARLQIFDWICEINATFIIPKRSQSKREDFDDRYCSWRISLNTDALFENLK